MLAPSESQDGERGLSGLSWPPSSVRGLPASSASAAVRRPPECAVPNQALDDDDDDDHHCVFTSSSRGNHARRKAADGGRATPPRKKAPPPPTASGAAPRRSPHRLPVPVRLSSAAMAAAIFLAPSLSFFTADSHLSPSPAALPLLARKTIDNLHMIKPRYCKKEGEEREAQL